MTLALSPQSNLINRTRQLSCGIRGTEFDEISFLSWEQTDNYLWNCSPDRKREQKKKEVRNKRTTDHVNVVNDTKDHTDSFNTGKGNVAFGSISCTLISKFSYYFFIHEWQALLCKSRGTDTKPSLSNNHTYSTESIPEHYSALNLLMGNWTN